MTREDAHKLIDELFDSAPSEDVTQIEVEEKERVLPEGKRIVRTKSSGDRVYLLDDEKKTRQWVTNPEILDSLGFIMEDVTEADDNDLLKYQMGPALYRVDNGNA